MRELKPYQIEGIQKNYPAGTVIRLNSMADEHNPVPAGTLGTVVGVDDIGSVMMNWENGRTLSLMPYADSFEIVSTPEQAMSEDVGDIGMKME